jgi:hypothetical protein
VALHIDIDHTRRLVQARARGVVITSEILEYPDRISVRNATSYATLVDATGTEFSPGDDAMMAPSARVSLYARMDLRGAIAFIADPAETENISRSYANFGAASRPSRTFGTVDDGRTWLHGGATT